MNDAQYRHIHKVVWGDRFLNWETTRRGTRIFGLTYIPDDEDTSRSRFESIYNSLLSRGILPELASELSCIIVGARDPYEVEIRDHASLSRIDNLDFGMSDVNLQLISRNQRWIARIIMTARKITNGLSWSPTIDSVVESIVGEDTDYIYILSTILSRAVKIRYRKVSISVAEVVTTGNPEYIAIREIPELKRIVETANIDSVIDSMVTEEGGAEGPYEVKSFI